MINRIGSVTPPPPPVNFKGTFHIDLTPILNDTDPIKQDSRKIISNLTLLAIQNGGKAAVGTEKTKKTRPDLPLNTLEIKVPDKLDTQVQYDCATAEVECKKL